MNGVLPFVAPTLSTTKLSFATVEYDDLDEYDASSSTFTAVAGGDYEVCVSLENFDNSYVDLHVEGIRRARLLSYHAHGSTGCTTVRVEAGDVLDVRMRNIGSYDVACNDNEAWLTINQLE